MSWSWIGNIGRPYWKIRSFLPSSLRTRADSLVQYRTPTDTQLKKIELLGERIGLNKKEVYAAYDSHVNLTHWKDRRLTPFSSLIILIIIMIACLVFWVLYINYFGPTTVYSAGPRYGSIKPQDFIQKSRPRM